MDKGETPFWTALAAYAARALVPFHTPGHKQGKGATPALRELVRRGLTFDLCDVECSALAHDPEAVLRRAEAAAARAVGAEATFFLWNGTTAGIQAMLLATCREGEKVLIPRDAHRSIWAGLALAGAEPVYLLPRELGDWGIAAPPTVEEVAAALDKHPQVRAVLITNPSYYGLAPDLQGISAVCRRRGVLLLVDEAHGAHFPFHPALPLSGVAVGADLIAQSTHKVLGALTQASMLHLGSRRVAETAVASTLALLQSSSPSFLLLASLDIARAQMETEGEELLARTLALARETRAAIKRLPGLRCLGAEDLRGTEFSLDPTRLVVDVRGLGMTGITARVLLREKGGLGAELGDAGNVVFLLTFADGPGERERLLAGLQLVAMAAGEREQTMAAAKAGTAGLPRWWNQPPPQSVLSPRAALLAPREPVPLAAASGRVCGTIVAPYPPGIPILGPGEIIQAETVAYLAAVQAAGWPVQGMREGKILCVT